MACFDLMATVCTITKMIILPLPVYPGRTLRHKCQFCLELPMMVGLDSVGLRMGLRIITETKFWTPI